MPFKPELARYTPDFFLNLHTSLFGHQHRRGLWSAGPASARAGGDYAPPVNVWYSKNTLRPTMITVATLARKVVTGWFTNSCMIAR